MSMTMVPAAGDSDGTHPMERIAIALEYIARDINKIANPPIVFDGGKFKNFPNEIT